jgi:hypothetical protein
VERRNGFELYVNYLVASHGKVNMTNLSELVDGVLSHNYLSRCLQQEELDDKAFWREVKHLARQIEGEGAVLSIDDVIVAKPHSTENELISYHYDHTKGRSVKGINILNFMLTGQMQDQELNVPVGWHDIRKTEVFHCKKTGKQRRKSPVTKMERSQHNHIFASMLAFCQLEKLKMKEKLNHFALKAKLYINALKASFQ